MKRMERKVTKALMARIFTVSIFTGPDTKATVATFDAKDIKKPVDGKIRGLYLTVTDPKQIQASLLNFLVPITGTNVYYLPYRSIPTPIKFDTPAGVGYFISLSFQVGTVFTPIKIVFEYDPDWETISAVELTTLVGWLEIVRVNRLTTVANLKASTISNASSYSTAKQSYEAALKGAAGLDAQIVAANAQIVTLSASIKTNDDTIKTVTSQILISEQNLINLNNQQTTASAQVKQLDQLLQANTESLKVLQLQKDSGETDTATFQNQMNLNKSGFESTLTSIKEEYANDYQLLENARKAVFDTIPPNLASANSYINQATPSY